nr:fibronectin type III domain-containing protein [uncultured Actinoplanes sp.]
MRRRWLGTLVLAPLLLGGCGSGRTTAAAVPGPSGSPWVLVAGGAATASPAPSRGTATPSPFASGFLPLPSTTPATTPPPTASCAGKIRGAINYATAVPSATSANVTWYNPGGNDLVEFRVTAIAQDLAVGEQRDIGWTVITPGRACGAMSATLTGLDRATDYVFSVDAVRTRAGTDGTTAETIARSLPTRTR